MDFEKLCDDALSVDPHVRFTGVLDSKGDLSKKVAMMQICSVKMKEKCQSTTHLKDGLDYRIYLISLEKKN